MSAADLFFLFFFLFLDSRGWLLSLGATTCPPGPGAIRTPRRLAGERRGLTTRKLPEELTAATGKEDTGGVNRCNWQGGYRRG